MHLTIHSRGTPLLAIFKQLFGRGVPLTQALGTMKRFASPGVWLLGIIAVTLSGLSSDPYLEYVRQIPPPHPYPAATVLWVALFMTVHAALLIAVLRPASYARSWGRAIIAFIVSFCFLALGVLGSSHSPPPWGMYLFWLLSVIAAIVAIGLWSVIGAIRSRAGT